MTLKEPGNFYYHIKCDFNRIQRNQFITELEQHLGAIGKTWMCFYSISGCYFTFIKDADRSFTVMKFPESTKYRIFDEKNLTSNE